MKKIYLVDVSSLFFRAFYAVRPLTSSQGVPVNAVYGFISMIIKLIKEKKPEYIVFCYDRKEPSFRKDLYSEYKANRTEMPDDLQVQMPYLKKVAQLFGITDIEAAGYEADDLIGTIAKSAEREGFQVYIVSGDKDFSQCVTDNIFLYDTMKEFVYNSAAVKEKHGVYPDQFIDFLAITGDTSDHIPGVAGVGPKGAQKLIEQFGTLEKIYDQIEKVEPLGLKEKLIKSKDNAFISKKLVTIVTDVPLNLNPEDYKLKPFRSEELRAFLKDLNFKSFEKTLLGDGQTGFENPISSSKDTLFESQAKALTESNQVKDTKTDYKLEIKSTSAEDSLLEVEKLLLKEKFFIFEMQDYTNFIFNNQIIYSIKTSKVNDHFKNFGIENFKNKNLKWQGFDLKRVWHILNIDEIHAQEFEIDFDLMLALYCLKSKDVTDVLTSVESYLNIDLSEELKTLKNEDNAFALNLFFKKGAELILQLNDIVKIQLEEKSLDTIFEKIEKPMIPILYQIEKNGIKLDVSQLIQFSVELENEISKLQEQIFSLTGLDQNEKFNIASPKQLGVVLFEKMQLPALKKTKTGYSTDNDVLEKLNHPIAQKLIEYRELTKLKSTYVDALPKAVDENQRLHTHFNQALTSTGRLSSTEPNLQNIPIKTEKGQRVRKAFIAENHCQLLSLDYSQIELRVLAHISNDDGLISAFKNDLDIHSATAAEVFSVDLKSVTLEQRRIAKAVNFGIAYGQGAYGLAETLNISRTESKEIIDRYFKKFSGIQNYIESTIKEAHEKKYVETLFGRRRYLTELDSSNAMVKKFGERAAINAPIQGTASDLMKMAMIDVQQFLKSNTVKLKQPVKMILQVHDELIFEGDREDLDRVSDKIKSIMENVARFKIPLKVNHAFGLNWDEAH